MSKTYRPTLETLESREVFSTAMGVVPTDSYLAAAQPQQQLSLNFTRVIEAVAAGDVTGDGVDAVRSSQFASDGLGIDLFQGGCSACVDKLFDDFASGESFHLLPYLEQDNLFKQFSALSADVEAVDAALASDLPWGDLNRDQIIAILIGLLQRGDVDGDRLALASIADGTSNTMLSVTHDAQFEQWASTFDSATPERQSQIIAILIGLFRPQEKVLV